MKKKDKLASQNIFTNVWTLTSFRTIIILLIIIVCIIFFANPVSWSDNNSQLILGTLSGLLVGFCILALQVFFDFENLKMHKTIQKSSLKEVLENRKNKQYYHNILTNAEKRIWIMGDTASRFLKDFGGSDEDDKQLIDELLNRDVEIRLLLFGKGARREQSTPYITKYTKKPGFEQYDFDASKFIPQSIFIVDNVCILGPILGDQNNEKNDPESRNTPAMHFNQVESIYTKPHLKYFEKIWNASKPNSQQ
jgi:hypothetical protein